MGNGMNKILSVQRDLPIGGLYHQCQGILPPILGMYARCGGDAEYLITFEGELTHSVSSTHLCKRCAESIVGPKKEFWAMNDSQFHPLNLPEECYAHILIDEWMAAIAKGNAINVEGCRGIKFLVLESDPPEYKIRWVKVDSFEDGI